MEEPQRPHITRTTFIIDRAFTNAERIIHKLRRLPVITRIPPRLIVGIVIIPTFRSGPVGRRILKYVVRVRMAAQLVTLLSCTSIVRSALVRELRHDTTRAIRALDWFWRVSRLLPIDALRLDLQNTDLSSLAVDPGGALCFRRANFSDTTATGFRAFGYMESCVFDRTELFRSSFVASDLDGASFTSCRLEECVLFLSVAREVSFRSASLQHVTFNGCVLRDSRFSLARLQNVVFDDCDLREAHFDGAILSRVLFRNCLLHGATGIGLIGESDVAVTLRIESRNDALVSAPITGAAPLPLTRPRTECAGDLTLRTVLGRASPQGRPEVLYRLEVAARRAVTWAALGSHYREMRGKMLAEPGTPSELEMTRDAFPRWRIIGVLQILFDPRGTLDRSCEYLLLDALHTSVEKLREQNQSTPELEVIVIDDLRSAATARSGPENQITVTTGLIVRLIRCARYSVAWLLPESVAFDEDWQHAKRPTRSRYADVLKAASQSPNDLERLPRIQLMGLRYLEGELLFQTWIHFILLHEIAHLANLDDATEGSLDESLSLTDRLEIGSDVFAARALIAHDNLDGGKALRESIEMLTVDEVNLIAKYGPVRIPSPDQPDSIIVKEGLSTIAEDAGWFPTAIASLLLILGNTTGYHSELPPKDRACVVITSAFGVDAWGTLLNDIERGDSYIGMLWNLWP